jgi:hypothetical protein
MASTGFMLDRLLRIMEGKRILKITCSINICIACKIVSLSTARWSDNLEKLGGKYIFPLDQYCLVQM